MTGPCKQKICVLDDWERNGSTSLLTSWLPDYDDDDDYEDGGDIAIYSNVTLK